MRFLLVLLALSLTACGADDAPAVVDTPDAAMETPAVPPVADPPVVGEPSVAVEPGEAERPAEPAITAVFDAREGALGPLLVGGWRIVAGPAETVSFDEDGTFNLYAHDRPMGSGDWAAEEDVLTMDGDTYVIGERRERGLTFAGGPDGTLVLERIDA